MTRLVVTGVERTFPGQVPVRALRNATLTIDQGDYVAIEGPSGSGKSTLLNQIALLDTPTGGTYTIDGADTAGLDDAARARLRSQTFAFIFQSFHLLGRRTVLDNVALGTLYRALPARQRRELARDALEFVGLAGKANQRTALLSGGERQRVAIARAITARTPVVVADEPTGNLDRTTGEQVMETLERLNATGTTLVIVTHDPQLAARAHKRLHVLDGVVIQQDGGAASRQSGVVGRSGGDGQGAGGSSLPHAADADGAGRAGGADGDDGPSADPPSPQPCPPGRASRVRLRDALADAWQGLRSAPSRTLALISSVALGVGLALATAGLSATAQGQVSDIFDAGRNQRVALTSPDLTQSPADTAAVTDPAGRSRLAGLAGVQAAAVLVSHDEVSVTTSANEPSSAGRAVPLTGVVAGTLPTQIMTVDLTGSGQAGADAGDAAGDAAREPSPARAPAGGRAQDGGAVLVQAGAGFADGHLRPGAVILGQQVAADLQIGPLMASPVVWLDGQPHPVAGVLTDAGLQLGLMSSVILSEPEAAAFSPPRWVSAELKVDSGAAGQVASQAPLAWLPTDPSGVSVDAPPDPTSLRGQIESSLRTMLLTLTGVALLAAVASLANSMTTAVFQRVGEFGLRRAIGARRVHVTALVVAESLIVGLLGGVVGVYVSMLGVLAVTLARHWQPVLDPVLVPIGLVGGVAVGLLGGAVATWRASRIEPADALRA